MCLIVFSYRKHPEFNLIFAANRDEFYERPSRPAQFWEDHPYLLAGKDLKGGGTWLGITKSGRFAAITNYRNPDEFGREAPSRGQLVLDFLKSSVDAEEYARDVHDRGASYNGFNLIVGNPTSRLFYVSNQKEDIEEIQPGIHGLSNGLMNTAWPKIRNAREGLRKLIEHDHLNSADLFELLRDEKRADDQELPNTGIGLEGERQLSPIFIRTRKYGTRNSTVVTVDKNGEVWFHERVYQPFKATIQQEQRFTFYLSDGEDTAHY